MKIIGYALPDASRKVILSKYSCVKDALNKEFAGKWLIEVYGNQKVSVPYMTFVKNN